MAVPTSENLKKTEKAASRTRTVTKLHRCTGETGTGPRWKGSDENSAGNGRVSLPHDMLSTPRTTLANPKGVLRPGMFVQTEVGVGTSATLISLPASAVSYAPFGDSVFVVTAIRSDKGQTYRGVRQQFVKLGAARGDQIAIVSGVKPGDEVVTSGVFKLRNGAAVVVNNKVRPGNNPKPKPENS